MEVMDCPFDGVKEEIEISEFPYDGMREALEGVIRFASSVVHFSFFDSSMYRVVLDVVYYQPRNIYPFHLNETLA